MRPFETWEDVEGLAAEMGDWGPAVCFAAATGLRPEELFALERRDLDRSGAVVLVRRVYTRALRVREGGKTDRSVRRVPLSDRALAALDELAIRIDTPLVFPRKDGEHVNQASWRRDEWKPAMRAWLLADPGRVERRPYDLRHTYASFQIAAGVTTFYLARFMGTSLAQIDRTYGHLLPDSEDYVRELQNAWEREQDERKAETQ
jgi:integrase